MIDHPKLARISLAHDVQRAKLHALSDLYHAGAGQTRRLAGLIEGSPFADMTSAELAGVHIEPEDARANVVDSNRRDQLDVARMLAAERDRMRELSRLIDEARATVEPLAALLTRLTRYATCGATA